MQRNAMYRGKECESLKNFEAHKQEELAQLRAGIATREKETAQLRARLAADVAEEEKHHA